MLMRTVTLVRVIMFVTAVRLPIVTVAMLARTTLAGITSDYVDITKTKAVVLRRIDYMEAVAEAGRVIDHPQLSSQLPAAVVVLQALMDAVVCGHQSYNGIRDERLTRNTVRLPWSCSELTCCPAKGFKQFQAPLHPRRVL